MEMLDNYVLMPLNNKLHITQRYGIITSIDKKIESIVNNEASLFLYYADGSKTVMEILEIVYRNKINNIKRVKLKQAIDFIREAEESGYLRLLKVKNYNKINITGSFEINYPIHYTVELTYHCNLKCIHCYANASHVNNKFINKDLLINYLEKSIRYGLRSIELTGGEPLTHPDFLPILLYSVNHFDQVGILTNGTLICRYIDELTELSREKGTAKKMFFSVSLYGPSGNIHDGITGVKGSFDLTIKGIKSLVKLGYFVRISMALMKQNVDYLEKTLDFARQLGVNSFNWDNTQPTGRGENTESRVYDYNNNQINLMHSQELVNKYKGFVPIIPYEQIKDKIAFGNCGAGHKNMVISPFGDLRPCSFLQKEFIPFGNIKDVPEIALNSEQRYYWSNLIQPGGKICEGCPYYSYCNGCFVRAVLAMRDQGKICEWGKSVNINKYLNFVVK